MSCHSATANQVRLVLHTAASRTNPLATCEFATLRERLIKIGARVIEHVARIRIQLPTSCPEGALFRPSRSACCRPAHEPRGCVPRRAADQGKSIPNALHSESPHTDPAGRIDDARQLA
jgi:hypothetical protein